jgi:hypothetical protein
MINITSIDEVVGREPISAMRRFVYQQRNGTYSDFDLETLAIVFSSFLMQRVEIDAVLLYKTKYKSGGAKKLKENIVELVFKTYKIPCFSVKTFERWHTKWISHVEHLLSDELQKDMNVREMNKRIIKNNTNLSDEEKEYYLNI